MAQQLCSNRDRETTGTEVTKTASAAHGKVYSQADLLQAGLIGLAF